LDVVNGRKLMMTQQWLYPSGIRLLGWLAQTPLYHIADVRDASSEGARSSEEEWRRFIATRINAHYAIDPELNETVLSRDAHEDGKKFEDAMEAIVGRRKKNLLMQLELDLSIPILKKYAEIMALISGIDQDVLIYELTLPDEEEKEREKQRQLDELEEEKTEPAQNEEESECEPEPSLTQSLLKEYLNNPKFADYKPVGLPVLVQNAEFNIIPSASTEVEDSYDRAQILRALSGLEKEVVQFQIDYKNEVYKVAGDKATELDAVMSTLQYRGLELTKWLRNFVKYMIARRDIEQEIVDVSRKADHKEAMAWFESMTNYLNGANNVLLKIISKLLLKNLVDAHSKYAPTPTPAKKEKPNECEKEQKEEEETETETESVVATKFERHEIFGGKKIEKLSSRYFELDCMVKLYVSIKKRFEAVMVSETFEDVSAVQMFIEEQLLVDEEVSATKRMLLSSLGLPSVKIAVLEVQIPATIIENQYGAAYKSWMRYPLTQTYLDKAKLFLERCKFLRDNVLCIIYSTVEKRCLLYATILTSPNKYYKCIGCQKIFGQLLCKNCNLAHYCSTECQRLHWDKCHKVECQKYSALSAPTCTVVLK